MNGVPLSLTFVLEGEPASKANSRRQVKIKGRTRYIKSEKALAFAESARWQAKQQHRGPMMPGRLKFIAHLYYATERPDLDESLVLDVLQGIAYKNDRQVREKHVIHRIDRARPRAEITLVALGEG